MRLRFGTSLRLAAGAGLLVAFGSPISGDSSLRDLGELYHSPVRGDAWRAVRDDVTGRKWFESEKGERAASVDEIALREWQALPELERIVESGLAQAISDPERAEETADVTIVFRRQPSHDAGMDARAKYAPLFAAPLARSREIVSRLASRRARPDHADPAEDQRLLTDEEKAQIQASRAEVLDLAARMRREVCDRASADAAADQSNVTSWLAARPGVTIVGHSWILSTVSARVPLAAIPDLVAAFPEIGRIVRIRKSEPTLNVSVPTINAGTWWTAGYTGSSSTQVAVLDTGVDSSHPALTTVSNSAVFLSYASTQSGFNDNASSTDDLYGHGTHVAGIVASNDSTNTGVAYGAGLMNAKCGYLTTSGAGSLQDPDIYSAGDWAANNGATEMNCSFGAAISNNDGSSGLALFFDAVVSNLSIDVAIAAGNSGSASGSVGSPGDAFNIVTAGNFDDHGTTAWGNDSLASSSSRGPTADGRRKPDVSAPGTNINSCNATWEASSSTSDDFVSLTGTSMASPHVAGSLALLRDYAASWSPEALKALLLTSSRDASPAPTSPDNNWGWGGLDLGAAYTDRASVFESTFTSSGPQDLYLALGSLSSGGRVTLAWNRHVTYNGAAAPTTSYSLVDLDLYLYDASNGNSLGSSTSSVDPVEQVKTTSAVTGPIVRISRYGNFPSGFSTEYFAIASESTTSATAVTLPALSCSFAQALPSPVGPTSAFTVPVTVTNSGGLPSIGTVVMLSLPTGYSCTETNGAITLGNIAPGGNATGTFHVTSGATTSGTKTIHATASTLSFDAQISSSSVAATQSLDADPPNGSVSVNGGAAYTGSANVTLTLSATDAVAGVDAMRLRNAGGAWTAWEPITATSSWTLATGEGTQTVDVQYRDNFGNAGIVSDGIAVDTTPPSGSVALNGGGAYSNAASVALTTSATDSASGVTDQRISTDGATFGNWETYGTTHTVSLPSGEGTTTRWAQFRDAVGNVSATVSTSVVRDVTPPAGSVVINGGAAFTNQVWVSIATAATDSLSGVFEMRIGTNGNSWSQWFPYIAGLDVSLPNSESANVVYVQYRDRAGNESPLYSSSIVVDSTGPNGSIAIENGAKFTAASSVTLSLTAGDPLSGVSAMRLRNEGGAWGSWQAYAASAPWTLPAGEGDRTVHVQYRDGSGNESADFSATITRDLTPPEGAVTILGGAAAVNHSDVDLDLLATDAASGVADVRVMNDGGNWSAWTPVADELPFTLTAGEGTRRIWAQFRDAVGNVSTAVSADILVDTTPPTGSIVLNGGAALIPPWETLTAASTYDDGAGGSGVVSVEFTRDGGATWSAASSVVAPGAVERPAGVVDAPGEIQARFRDAAGNVSAPASASAYFVAAPVQGLDSAKTLKGVIAQGGDVDAYSLELIEGDVLTIKETTLSAKKGGAFGADLDVYDPSHAKIVGGRWPSGAKKAGVVKLKATATGTYVVIVRGSGADAASGGSYALAASIARAKSRTLLRGPVTRGPSGSSQKASIVLTGTEGGLAKGTLKLASPTMFHLVAPDGTSSDFLETPKRGVAQLALPFADGTGAYTLSASMFGNVSISVRLSAAPRTGTAVERLVPGSR